MSEPFVRRPDMFPFAQMSGEDFDGTIAQTFEPAPSGIGVREAYEIAVEGVFGEVDRQRYVAEGGLRNRAPREVVADLHPDMTPTEVAEKTAKLTAAKLSVLMDQIDSQWPQPIPGYLKFNTALARWREDFGISVDEVVISSGHHDFIRKTFQTWGAAQPLHVVASEVTENHSKYKPEDLVKPKVGLMVVARELWRGSYGLPANRPQPDELERILYIGDDPDKDGKLAKASGVDFIQITRKPAEFSEWNQAAYRFILAAQREKDHGRR